MDIKTLMAACPNLELILVGDRKKPEDAAPPSPEDAGEGGAPGK